MASVAALARYFEKTAAVGPAPAAAPLPPSTSGSGSRIARVPQHKLAAFTVSAAPTGKPSTTTPRTLGPLHAKWQAAIENNSSVVTLVSPTFTLAAAAAADHGHAEEAVDDDSTGNEEMVVSAADTDDEDEITEETADSLAPASTYSSSNPPSVILQAEEATVTETVDDEERSIASVQSVILAPFAMLVQKCPEAAAPPVHCGVKPVAPLIRADSRQPAADDSDLKMPHHAMPATATSKAVANPYHGPHWLSFPPAGIAVAITTVSAQAYARTVRDPVVWEETEGTDGDNSSSGLRVKAERDLKRWHALGAEAQLLANAVYRALDKKKHPTSAARKAHAKRIVDTCWCLSESQNQHALVALLTPLRVILGTSGLKWSSLSSSKRERRYLKLCAEADSITRRSRSGTTAGDMASASMATLAGPASFAPPATIIARCVPCSVPVVRELMRALARADDPVSLESAVCWSRDLARRRVNDNNADPVAVHAILAEIGEA